ncbi:MAG: FAD-dependent oxidoreductase [Deltaproteobacteria bacterium]|nr:FAD-dependent oxidoreductase [Deltaproteobacteria bacterium]MDQ3299053.1 FAD-binding oxidoreductase [Myxococcota bacterium]
MERAFDDNTAPWLIGAPPDEPAPALARDLEVDVAIIGGGFTGVSTAYHLSRRFPGRGIALLEARRLANGASGRNGGLMLNGITVKDLDPDLMAREHALTCGAIDALAALIAEHRLAVRFRRTGCVHLSTTQRSAEEAHERVEQLRARGLPLRFLRGPELEGVLRARGAHGAVFDPTEGVINGVDLIRAMRPLLVAQGVQIFEATPVTRVRNGNVAELVTPHATVRARAIVLATSGYTPRLGFFRTGLLPVISHVIATDPLPRELLDRLGLGAIAGFFDDLPRLAYCSTDDDGRLIFGGGTTAAYGYRYGNATAYAASPDDAGTRALRGTLASYLPELADVPIRHRWSGPLDLTLARHCAIGVTGAHRNIYYAVGYSGHGIVLANLAGRVLTDLYAGDHDAWRDYAFYMKSPSGIPSEPLRWLGYQLYTRLTGRSPWKRPA